MGYFNNQVQMRTCLILLLALAVVGLTLTHEEKGLKAAEEIPTAKLQIDDLESTDDPKAMEVKVPVEEIVVSEVKPKVKAVKIDVAEQTKPEKKIDVEMIKTEVNSSKNEKKDANSEKKVEESTEKPKKVVKE